METIKPKLVPTTFEELVARQLADVLQDELLEFQLVKLDGARIIREVVAGKVTLPLVDEDMRRVSLDLVTLPIQLRLLNFTKGVLKSEFATLVNTDLVTLPPELNYRLGECARLEPNVKDPSCGALTILDQGPDPKMVSGMVIHPSVGVTYFEPVKQVLGVVGNWDGDGLHILYNSKHTVPPVFDAGDTAFTDTTLASQVGWRVPGLASPLSRPAAATLRQTEVVLDGDVQFYNIDPSTVWSRMESVHNIVSVIYELIEPFSDNSWGLYIPIKGMEVWIAGGPSTTDNDALVTELTDPGYTLINTLNDDELHMFFVGYNVSNVYGQAAGIGSASGGFGGGSGKNHVFSEARSSQTFKTKWVVMAHEWGHLIGSRHGDGETIACASGFLNFVCGPSLMLPGSAGSPDTRGPYFSDANDANIIAVIDSLPSWP